MLKRKGREYTKSGRLIKIEPARPKMCKLRYLPTPECPWDLFPEFEFPKMFNSRKAARKVLNKFIKRLPPRKPGAPHVLVIVNL